MTLDQIRVLKKLRHCLSCSCETCSDGKHTSALAMSKDCDGCLRLIIRLVEGQTKSECARLVCEECALGLPLVLAGKYKGLHQIDDPKNVSYCACRAEKILARPDKKV